MLDAEEVDVDHFTPSSSGSTKEEDVLEKTSLKYDAPLPPQIAAKPEEPKRTQYLFAVTNLLHTVTCKAYFAVLVFLFTLLTSLSTIFSGSTKEDTKPEEPKRTQYLFAGTVYAYKWANNTYEFRGRLGFAIYKIAGFDGKRIMIYDSNKTTLSSLTLTNNVVIKVNSNKRSISYYDNQRKFWSVNPSTSGLENILEILSSSNVKLEFKPAVENINQRD